jgi:predicted permease
VPGVRGVSLLQPALLSGNVTSTNIFVQGRVHSASERSDDSNEINRLIVSPDFFRVVGIPMVMGRALNDRDTASSPQVAVINEAAVRAYFKDVNPVGAHFGMAPDRAGEVEVVGILRDAKYSNPREPAPPTMYASYLQRPRASVTFALRTEGAPTALANAVRAAVRDVDANLPISSISTQIEQMERRFVQERLFAQAYSLFGAIALLLASVGLFGLMSYNVARRTAEMGIRMALGAQRLDVLRMVMRESLTLVGIGVGAGVAVALVAGRLIANLLFGLPAHDAATMAIAVLVMAGVSALAAYLPARRASHVDPMVALRYE